MATYVRFNEKIPFKKLRKRVVRRSGKVSHVEVRSLEAYSKLWPRHR